MSKKGKNSRFEEVFSGYRSQLKRFISSKVSSDESVDDILSDLFYRFVVSDGEAAAIEHTSAWLYRVASNLITDHFRKKREQPMPYVNKGSDSEPLAVPISDMLHSDMPSPEGELFSQTMANRISSALAELPSEQRSIFELNEIQGISFKEISEATGIPINTLLSRKRYAVLHLRKRLSDLYKELDN